jgi:signal transduction histidine kinase
MATVRGRLTAWYAAALTLTLAGFALVIYSARRRAAFQELDRRVVSEAELTAGILAGVYRAGGVVVQPDEAGRVTLASELTATLDVVPDYLVITTVEGRIVFASAETQPFSFQQVEQLADLARRPPPEGAVATVTVQPRGPRLRYAVRPVTGAGPELGAVIAGATTAGATLELQQLLGTFALTLPFGMLVAYLVGSWIAERALAPVDEIITEVREITDGRSLHRRLPVPIERDELGRLAETLNEMMGRLERSFGALRRFTADASHELKTPLTVLRGGVERAVRTPGLPRDTLQTLEEALQEVNHMTELVDTLLTLARADEGRAPLHREVVDLRAIVEEARETGDLLAEPAGLQLTVETPAEPLLARVDRSRIRQLLLNLLTNAVKYTPPGGRVRLRLTGVPGWAVLNVADTGIGIAPADLPQIFDRFWRADTARTRTGERAGAGLGLAIGKWIAEAHGGSIEVRSRPGRGTAFTVRLPLDTPPELPAEALE